MSLLDGSPFDSSLPDGSLRDSSLRDGSPTDGSPFDSSLGDSSLLDSSSLDGVRKCLILAAGRGARMDGAGDCKPLLLVGGLPLIERTIVTARRAGLTEFYVVTGYEAPRLEAFLAELAQRRRLAITVIRNDEWPAGNGRSLLQARASLDEDFALLMADHVFDEAILSGLLSAPRGDADIVLAADLNVSDNPLVDGDEATKIRTDGQRIVAIGKTLEDYNAYDSGIFLCTPAIFDAVEASLAGGDASISAAVQRVASQGRARIYDLREHGWIDVDTPQDRATAERFLSGESTKSLDGWVSRHLNRPLSRRLFTPLLLRAVPRITPNQVSLLSFGVAAAASVAFFLGQPLVGGVAIQLASILDGSDGEIARLKKLESPFGGFLDALLDRYSDSLILFGMAYFAWTASANARLFGGAWEPLIALVAVLAIVGTLMVSYSSAKAFTDFGHRYRGRWVAAGRGRDLRLFLLFLAGVLAVIHPLTVFVALLLIAALTNAIVLRRVWISAARERGAASPTGGVRAVVFDFDGTVADTMPFLSDLAVTLLTQHYGVSPQQARRRYRETSGVDFASQVAEMFPGHPANGEVIATFERRKLEAILAQPAFPETIRTLRALRQRGIHCFIVSSSPPETVAAYTRRHGIDSLLDDCRGLAPGFDKVGQLQSILQERELHPDEVLFVGDSLRDHDVASALGVRFVGVRGGFDARAVRERGLVNLPDLAALTPWLAPSPRMGTVVTADNDPEKSRASLLPSPEDR